MFPKMGKTTRLEFKKRGRNGKNLILKVVGVKADMLRGKKKLPSPIEISAAERDYFVSLHEMADAIFQEAADMEMTWCKLASVAGLGYQTVDNLGCRRTKFPQYRTIYKLAIAVGFELNVSSTRKNKKKLAVAAA